MIGSKQSWREHAKDRRAATADRRAELDSGIVTGLVEWLAGHGGTGTVVVLFDPLPGEPDLWPLVGSDTAVELETRFALTRTPEEGFALTVHSALGDLEPHRFGYRQPAATEPEIPDAEVGVVLVPALAFDRWGNRLGFGAGYYDRFLARLPNAVKIGIADEVLSERLPVEQFDIPMDLLATPAGVVPAESSS